MKPQAYLTYKSAAHGTGLSTVFHGAMSLKSAQKICASNPNHRFVKTR